VHQVGFIYNITRIQFMLKSYTPNFDGIRLLTAVFTKAPQLPKKKIL